MSVENLSTKDSAYSRQVTKNSERLDKHCVKKIGSIIPYDMETPWADRLNKTFKIFYLILGLISLYTFIRMNPL